MKTQYKIIVFASIVIIVVIVLVFWWRSISGGDDEKVVDAEPTVGPGFEFQDVPRADGSVVNLFDDDSSKGSAPVSGFSLSAQGSLERISDNPAFFFWVNQDTGEVFYLTSDGEVFLAEEGGDVEISSQTLSGLQKAMVSPKGEMVLALF